MGDPPPLRVDTPALSWEPAVVTVPPVPVVAPGPDPMSTMIAAIMPELATPLTEAVAATHAREERFAANLAAARGAYQTTDQSGGEEIQTAAADTQVAPATAAATGGGSAASGGSAGGMLGQLMGMAGQATQAPMQAMGMAASAPQGVMQGAQGAVQQIGQLTGQGDKPAGDAKDVDIATDDRQTERGDEDAPRSDDGAQRSEEGDGAAAESGERAPTDGAAPVRESRPQANPIDL